jgi:hypothetical protein
MTSEVPAARNPISAIRQFVRKPQAPPAERCALCGLALHSGHSHLLEPATRGLVCSCEACAVLFTGRKEGRYRRIPRDIESLAGFRLSDERWEELHLPINLTFFVRSTEAERVLAFYPSPAGAVESLLPLDAWQALVDQNPVLRELEPDVEALLVNRVHGERAYYRAPIDECFKLVGLIRAHWRGLSGGTEVWQEVDQFFASLKKRARSR